MPNRILLVDDDATVLSTLKSVFETRNFKVSTAVSARDALSEMETQLFELVVTDMRMETDTAGFEVVHRAAALANHPVIVILSAYPIPATEWRSSGADVAFLKGGGIFRILDEIDRLLLAHFGKQSAAS